MTATAARVVAALLAGVVLTACSGDGDEAGDAQAQARLEQTCTASVDQLVLTTQRYIDAFSPGAEADTGGDLLTEDEYVQAVSNLRDFAASSGCDEDAFQEDVRRGLEGVRADSPLGRAVLLQLRAGDVRGGPQTVPAAPGDDLAALAARLPSGSTIELGAGEHVLGSPLVLLRGVTLRGASRDTTVLSSAGADGVLLVLTGEESAVTGLELRRTEGAPGPVVVVGPAARLTLDGVRVAGAREDAEGTGGSGILLAPGPEGTRLPEASGPQRPTTLHLVASELVDNQSAGLVVSGEHRAEVEGSTFVGAGQCGVCFLGESDGLVTGSTFTDNTVGVVAAGSSRPAVTASTVRGGEVSAQLGEKSQAVLQGNELAAAKRAAVIAGDAVGGRLEGNRCVDVDFGIVVNGAAAPYIGENEGCDVVRGQDPAPGQ